MGGSSLYIEAMAIRHPADYSSSPSSTASDRCSGNDSNSNGIRSNRNDFGGGEGERGMGGSGSSGGRLRTTGQLGDVMNESAQVGWGTKSG